VGGRAEAGDFVAKIMLQHLELALLRFVIVYKLELV
jgi:hypothetical protein